ncbi:hypothetical protein RFI_36928, partial [Reticulomyxa filosa]
MNMKNVSKYLKNDLHYWMKAIKDMLNDIQTFESQLISNIICNYHQHAKKKKKISDESFKKQQVVEIDYDISKYTYMPSLFGHNQLIFAEEKDILIVKRCDYFTTLKKEIDNRLIGKYTNARRAALVFFESKKQLMEFYESSNFLAMKENPIIKTEENTHEEKEYLIKRATTSGQVGLFTRSFGRGTDFVCRDQI